MAGLPQQDTIKYAEFLVEVFPERVIDFLSDTKVCKRDDVADYYERLWPRLGDEHTVKGHLMRREFNQLRAIKESRYGSSSTFPSIPVGRPSVPSPPMSTPSVVSDSRSVQRPVHEIEWINVMQSRGPVQLTYRRSGSDLCFIGQDKLHAVSDRLPTQTDEQRFEVGGQYRFVNSYIHLTWYFPGDGRSNESPFWVLPSGTIKDTHVLIGFKTGEYSRFPGRSHHRHHIAFHIESSTSLTLFGRATLASPTCLTFSTCPIIVDGTHASRAGPVVQRSGQPSLHVSFTL